MNKNLFLITLAALGCACGLRAADAKKPNILIICADDMGFSDAGCYGGEIQTPNLDGLAANGLRFTQFYNTARCWSSRSSLMSGFYAQAIRRDAFSGNEVENVPDAGGKGNRPRWAQLLPEYLKPLGYRSYHSGKWHIDGKPTGNGFDHSYELDDHNNYFAPKRHSEDDKNLPAIKSGTPFYTTSFIADEAIKFLQEHAEKHADTPFFEYLAFTSPHFPLHALPEDIAVYKDRYSAGWDVVRQARYERMKQMGIINGNLSPLDPKAIPRVDEQEMQKKIHPDEVGRAVPWDGLTTGQKKFQAEKMAVHAAMVHRMDIDIGRVLDQLRKMGALDNTIVFFLSDNGASAEQIVRGDGTDPASPAGSEDTFLGIGPGWGSVANSPLRMYKKWNHEGWIATPLIVSWPAGLRTSNELRTTPGHLIDIVPTVLELAGAKQPATVAGLKTPPLQGKSLVPAFAKEFSIPREYLWWSHSGNRAIRIGDWKLVANGNAPWELYDLGADRSETKNMAAAHPEKVQAMEKAWIQHAKEFLELARQDAPPASPKKAKNRKNKADEE